MKKNKLSFNIISGILPPFGKWNILFMSIMFWMISFSSCIDIEEFEDSPRGNFEALWKIMDERYCFFEYKQVDWNRIHDEYLARVTDDMGKEALFYLLDEMLQELKDGHVNLYSPFDVGRYWKWFEDHPTNFSADLVDKYLGTDYLIASGIKYKILPDNVGYMYYGDFSNPLGKGNLSEIIKKFALCDGIIIDVRNNGGGMLSNSETLASKFVNQKTLVGYIQHKTGKGHNDFSEPYPKYVEPSGDRYQKPVVVLTNRKCYSATNDFVNSMRMFPTVTILGDSTGGGGGLPFSSEIPNGWSVRFSASPLLDANKEQIEFGIKPDIKVDLLESDVAEGRDTLIEAARKLLKEQSEKQKSLFNL